MNIINIIVYALCFGMTCATTGYYTARMISDGEYIPASLTIGLFLVILALIVCMAI